ncbi:MAG: transposase [Desulfovibrio sp.]|nr:transposase [Desulfovibrio sp.]
MKRSFRVKLHLNNIQQTKMFEMSDAARFAYNYTVEKQMEKEENHECFIDDKTIRRDFTQYKKLEENKWLTKISNDVTKQSIKDCCNAFKRFTKIQSETKILYTKKKLIWLKKKGKSPTNYDKNGHPKFKSKEHSKVHFYQDPVKITFTSTHVKLEKITESRKRNRQKANWIRLAERDRIPVNAHYENPRITFDGTSWWISVVCEIAVEPMLQEKTTGICCDLGINWLATYSDGTYSENINKSITIKKLEKKKKTYSA